MKLSHLDAEGRARMVDVGDKPVSDRRAVATGAVRMSRKAYELVAGEGVPKGDVLAVAEVAGVMGAKRTGELIPLCHPLGLDHVQVEARLDPELPGVQVTAAARVTGRTGVEMEALTAVTVACLTSLRHGEGSGQGDGHSGGQVGEQGEAACSRLIDRRSSC